MSARRQRLALPFFLSAELFSFFAIGASNVALPWLVLERTGDPSLTGLLYALTAVPGFAAAILGGGLIDRWGGRLASIVADVGSATSSAGLVVVDSLARLTFPWFLWLGTLGAVCRPPGMAARQGLIGDVARARAVDIDRVAGARQSVYGVAFLAGPAIAGVLLGSLGAVQVLIIIAACHAASALSVVLLALGNRRAAVRSASPLQALMEVRLDRTLRGVMVLGFLVEMLAAPLVVMVLPAYFAAQGRPEFFGYSVAGFALGAIVGALVYAPLVRGRARLAYTTALALLVVGLGLLATLGGVVVISAGLALAGMGTGLVMPFLLVYMNEVVPAAARGRVLGLFNALALASYPAGLGLSSLALRLGASLGTVTAALFVVCVVCVVWALWSPHLAKLTTRRTQRSHPVIVPVEPETRSRPPRPPDGNQK